MGTFTKAQLFARLEAEGKAEDAKAFFDSVYEQEMQKRARSRGAKAKFANRVAVIATAKKYPPDPRAEWRVKKAMEREHELQVVKDENAKLRAKEQFEDKLRAQREAAEDLRAFHVVEALKDKTDCAVGDLPEPLAWALSHVHEITDVDDPSKWHIQPHHAPSSAHWNLLMYAATKTSDFMEKCIKEMIDAKKRQEDREAALESLRIKAQNNGKPDKPDVAQELGRRDKGRDLLDELLQKVVQSGHGFKIDTTGTGHLKSSQSVPPA